MPGNPGKLISNITTLRHCSLFTGVESGSLVCTNDVEVHADRLPGHSVGPHLHHVPLPDAVLDVLALQVQEKSDGTLRPQTTRLPGRVPPGLPRRRLQRRHHSQEGGQPSSPVASENILLVLVVGITCNGRNMLV